MKKQTKNIPQLRFPEFEGDYVIKRIDELMIRESHPVSVNPDIEYRQIGVRSHGKGIFYKDPVIGKQLGNKRVFWIKENMFIVNIVFAWEQAVSKTTTDELGMIASHRFPMYRPYETILNLDYILFLFKTKKGKYLLELASPGGAGRNKTLGQQSFNELKIPIPTFPEQQKIASFLSAIDKKIQQLTRKNELLEQYKKGVMQKIFLQEIRFKDENGNDYPDWEEKRLGELLTFVPTNSLSRNDLNYKSGSIKNIHYGDIHTRLPLALEAIKVSLPFINDHIDIKKISNNQYCQSGDIVIADASEDYNDIGKTIEIIDVGNEKIVAGLHTFLGRDVSKQTVIGFKGCLFQTDFVRKQIQKFAQGISVLGISKKNLEHIRIPLPSKEEQEQIVRYLMCLDEILSNYTLQLQKTQSFKKALLQRMFV